MVHKSTGYNLLVCTLVITAFACSSSESDVDPTDAPPSSPTARAAVSIYSIGTDAGHPALRNQVGRLGSATDTGLIVMDADRIEIKPSYLTREQRKVAVAQVVRQDNNVCTQTSDVCIASVPIYENQCDDHCSVCAKCSFFGCIPWRCCDTVCQNVHTGDRCIATQNQCAQHQNQWQDTSTYSGLEAPEMVKDTAPMRDAAFLLAGLKLRFSFIDPNGAPQQIDCALSQFKPKIDAEKFSIALHNIETCATIFVAGAQSPVTLGLVNAMNAPIPYLQGTLVQTWDGRVLEKPVDSSYLAAIDFAGTISVFAGGAAPN